MNIAVAAVGVQGAYAGSGTPPAAVFVGVGLALGMILLVAAVCCGSRGCAISARFLSFRR
ncbi:MAG: hypothetical protein KGJ84_03085 [Elusimicrobia bacterium]|nr:hypothetical protein [Elusimicrobiota bacterium]